jgi:Icc-related predicted phosphoesterase
VKFIAISDTHCRHHSLKLPKGDAVIHSGDITYVGSRWEVVDFLTWFSSLNYQYKIFIAGNHDFYFEKHPSEIKKLIPENVTYLNDSGIIINGINIWGSPVTPWFFNWAFNRRRGKVISKHWNLIPDNTQLLITHGPAFGILDTVINGENVGCEDLLKKLQQVKPNVHVCGHIHESYGTKKKGETKFINASILNEHYELAHRPITFEL